MNRLCVIPRYIEGMMTFGEYLQDLNEYFKPLGVSFSDILMEQASLVEKNFKYSFDDVDVEIAAAKEELTGALYGVLYKWMEDADLKSLSFHIVDNLSLETLLNSFDNVPYFVQLRKQRVEDYKDRISSICINVSELAVEHYWGMNNFDNVN